MTSPTGSKCSISSGIKFVLNTQGPGPFTFNINLSGLPAESSLDSINFTVNTNSTSNTGATVTPRVTRQRPNNGTRAPPRPFLLPQRAQSNTTQEAGEIVPETPQSQLGYSPRSGEAIDSQNVDAPDSPRNSMPSTDATEYSDDYKDDQSPATFSPNCPVSS
ncbi:hypothetical protein MSAN_01964200 [Mycena sanguinolenta]|uniref:Uncharacterized protein n=1 Tax=Mycena sanguinolenta TaxID=230812 RepID=A0A8H6XLG1_9AGAR|nr:hypothetical protein MSAN_01964200 [Mycena sanguinolenta]